MSLHLHVMSGPDLGRSFPIMPGPDMLIGRGAHAYYQLSDQKVARNHCQVLLEGDQATVICNGGEGGTRVNGEKIERHVLKPGDVLRVGQTQLEVRDIEEPPEKPEDEELEVVEEAELIEEEEPWENLVGTHLAHFDVGELIGEGRHGAVFAATDTKTRHAVALKLLRPAFGKDEEAVKRFAATMKKVLPLKHPQLVAVLAAGKSHEYCWVAMEHVAGKSLAQMVEKAKADGPPEWKRGYKGLVQGARALQFIHAQHLVQRHVIPTNVFRETETKTIKFGDLMLAHALGGIAPQGKPEDKPPPDLPYLSPEQTQGAAVDARSDLYGLGVTVHALLTGQVPFGGKNLGQMMMRVREMSPEKLAKYQPGIPPPFEAVVQKLLAKKPAARFQTADELLAELDRVGKLLKLTE